MRPACSEVRRIPLLRHFRDLAKEGAALQRPACNGIAAPRRHYAEDRRATNAGGTADAPMFISPVNWSAPECELGLGLSSTLDDCQSDRNVNAHIEWPAAPRQCASE